MDYGDKHGTIAAKLGMVNVFLAVIAVILMALAFHSSATGKTPVVGLFRFFSGRCAETRWDYEKRATTNGRDNPS